MLEASEAIGAAGYALIGAAGLIIAGVYLKNFLPLGTPAMLLSAGMMPINSVAVGLEVTGAFLVVLDGVPRSGADRRARRAGRAMSFLPYVVAAWLFLIGLYGVVSSHEPDPDRAQPDDRPVLDLPGLLGVGYRTRRQGADRGRHPPSSKLVDPVVQVLVLTDVVIEATVTALLLALVVQAHKRFGSIRPADLRALRD